MIANSHTDEDKKGFQIVLERGGNELFADIGTGGSEGMVSFHYPFEKGKWYFVALVYDGLHIKLYLDGVLMGESAYSGAIADSGYAVNIGRNPVYDGDYFTGSVDEVRIYSVALNGSDIRSYCNLTLDMPIGMVIQGSGNLEVYGNSISGYYYNMKFVDVGNVSVHNNKVENASSYGVYVDSSSSGNMFYNNSFYFNNGSNDTFNASHIQAYDAGNDAWNTSSGYGNFWYDWQSPDSDGDGIVDVPYQLDGGAVDHYPLTNAAPIPELSMLVLVVLVLFAVLLVKKRH